MNINFSIMRYLIVVISWFFLQSCIEKEDNSKTANNNQFTTTEQKNYKTYCNPIDIDYSYMSHYQHPILCRV